MSEPQEQNQQQTREQLDHQRYSEFQAYEQLRQQEQQRLIMEQQRVIEELEQKGFQIRNRPLVGEFYQLLSNPPRLETEAEKIEKAATADKLLREHYRAEFEEEQRLLQYQQQIGIGRQPAAAKPAQPPQQINPYQAMSMQGSPEVRNLSKTPQQNTQSIYERGKAAADQRRAEWERMRGM